MQPTKCGTCPRRAKASAVFPALPAARICMVSTGKSAPGGGSSVTGQTRRSIFTFPITEIRLIRLPVWCHPARVGSHLRRDLEVGPCGELGVEQEVSGLLAPEHPASRACGGPAGYAYAPQRP